LLRRVPAGLNDVMSLSIAERVIAIPEPASCFGGLDHDFVI
jgi:hypothetical protein